MPPKIQSSGAQKRKISKESNERNTVVLVKTKRLTEYFSASLLENIEVNNEEPVPDDVSSEEPPAFPSTSAENENKFCYFFLLLTEVKDGLLIVVVQIYDEQSFKLFE